MDYGKINKKICFDSTDKMHAELKICLHYDEIKIKEFFNEIVDAYLNKNKYIIAFIDELKEKKAISKSKRVKTHKADLSQQQVINKFGLNEKEIENIFDIIEKENPEL